MLLWLLAIGYIIFGIFFVIIVVGAVICIKFESKYLWDIIIYMAGIWARAFVVLKEQVGKGRPEICSIDI